MKNRLFLFSLMGVFLNSAHARVLTIQYVGTEDKSFSSVVDQSIASLLSFSKNHQLKIDRTEIFVEKVVLYETKDMFDNLIASQPDWKKGTPVPNSYVGVGFKKEFHVVSWDAYKLIHPQDAKVDYQNLITHELTHLLHIAHLKGHEEAMGPTWFFEGLACFAANQYLSSPLPPREKLNEILSDKKRGSYPDYAAILRALVRKKSVAELIKKAKSKNFSNWAEKELQQVPR